MAEEFKNKYIRQIYEDLSLHTKAADLDMDMEQALKDFGAAFATSKTYMQTAELVSDMAQLLENCAEKIAVGLEAAPDARKAGRIAEFSKILSKAVEFDPKNSKSFLRSALNIESAHPEGYAGVFTDLATKLIIRHPRQTETVLNATDEFVADYAAHNRKDINAYNGFYEIYTTAYRKPFSKQIQNRAQKSADEIFYTMDFIKNEGKLNKAIERIQKKPEDETVLNAFERSLKQAVAANPAAAAADLADNAKALAKIENVDTRMETYNIIIETMAKDIPAATDEVKKAKSDMMMTFIQKVLKTDKDREHLPEFAVTAVYNLYPAITDENGAIFVADGREKQTFGALNKIADLIGHRAELRQLLNAAHDKYKHSSEIEPLVQIAMMHAVESADLSGKKIREEYTPTVFENQMRNAYKRMKVERQHNYEICSLLNIENRQCGYIGDLNRTRPTKSEMRKAVNILCQYSAIRGYLPDQMLSKIDMKKFSNVDDAILNKFEEALPRMENKESLAKRIADIRNQLHMYKVEDRIVLGKGGLEISETHDLTPSPAAKTVPINGKTPTEKHAPKKFELKPKDAADLEK